jgi:uncharacterized protein with PIN domain
MLKAEEKNEEKPICPHCNSEIEKINFKRIEAAFGKRYVYFCSKCNKILGISHRKGFWMG